MVKTRLKDYVGQLVTVTLFNKKTYTGKLRETGTRDLIGKNTMLFYTSDMYFIELDGGLSPCFKCSHVTRLEKVR